MTTLRELIAQLQKIPEQYAEVRGELTIQTDAWIAVVFEEYEKEPADDEDEDIYAYNQPGYDKEGRQLR